LNLIQQNAKFFLQVLASQKSNNLEWIIVFLILAECILMCVEMSGLGGTLFQSLLASGGWVVTAPRRRATALVPTTSPVEQDSHDNPADKAP